MQRLGLRLAARPGSPPVDRASLEAARLIGAAGAMGKDMHQPPDPLEEELVGRAIADGRAALGNEAWERALADGASLGGTAVASLAREGLEATEDGAATRD